MLTRRHWIRTSAAAGAALTISPELLRALGRRQMTTRTIPGTNEAVPIVGLGSSATFSRVARGDDVTQLRDVLRTFVVNGGTVFDRLGVTHERAGGSDEAGPHILKRPRATRNPRLQTQRRGAR